MNTHILSLLAMALPALALSAPSLTAQVGDVTRIAEADIAVPEIVESSTCVAERSTIHLVLDRAARLERDAAKDYLRGVADSMDATGEATELEEHYFRAAVFGAQATLAGGMDQVRAAEAAFRHSSRVLELEPGHHGAAYILGRLHAGVMRTSRITRFLATKLMGGGALADASWDEARRLLELAVEGSPCDSEYRYELGRVHADTGRPDLALEELGRAVRLPNRGARAREARDAARDLRNRLLGGGD